LERKREGVEKVEVKVKAIGEYAGHSIKSNKSIDINFKCNYDQLTNYVQLIQLLNENVDIVIRIEKQKPFKLGMFMVKQIVIGSDGQGTLKFNSQLDYVEKNNLNDLSGELLQLMFKANVEEEDEDEEETE
jgi:hypothetical protein